MAAHLDQHATMTEQMLGFFSEDCGTPRQLLDDSRWEPAATVLLFRELPADVRVQAATPSALLDHPGFRWAGVWIDDLARCYSRLPPGTDPAVLRRLAGLFAGGTSDIATWAKVCVACGLRRPVWPDDGSHAHPCPHCGVPDAVPARGGEPVAFPWREAARRDLESVLSAF